MECGNWLYQSTLDRYIARQDVPFTEVRKAWRNTTQTMCGTSGFFEQLFPLVRKINKELPPGKPPGARWRFTDRVESSYKHEGRSKEVF